MSVKNDKHEASEQHMAEGHANGSDGVTAQCSVECGAEVFEHAEKAVSDAYDKTAQVVSETYEQAKNYSSKNPGKAMFITLGIGVGVGFLVGANYRRSVTDRFAQPVVNALSDIALAFFR